MKFSTHDYDEMLRELQETTFHYFLRYSNPENGLVADYTEGDSPASITAVGLALTAYPVAIERNFISREEGIERTLATLRFFWDSPQSEAPDATGYKGFYYHFLDMETGRRAMESELSTVDTSFLVAGFLTVGQYFNGDNKKEEEIRELADKLYRRVDWEWFSNKDLEVEHSWKPEEGFAKAEWLGYNEAFLLYILGLGSPTYPLPAESYQAWTKSYMWKKVYGIEYLFAGPLFIHQLPHIWVDFRGIQDEFMRSKSLDYFENSRRATYVQQHYAIDNPLGYLGYGEFAWGITASGGPGPDKSVIEGISRHFYGYEARGVPFGPDDGTLSPWASIASLPFAPELVLPTIKHLTETYPEMINEEGFQSSFNPTYPPSGPKGWVADGQYGLNQGPIVLMIENYFSGLIWRLMRQCPYIVDGLNHANFRGGWLGQE